jgi:transposase
MKVKERIKHQHYDREIKEAAVRLHLEDGLTKKEVCNRLGITDEQRVKKWCSVYRKKGLVGLQYKTKGRPKKYTGTEQENMQREIKSLRMEIQLLRNFLCEIERG